MKVFKSGFGMEGGLKVQICTFAHQDRAHHQGTYYGIKLVFGSFYFLLILSFKLPSPRAFSVSNTVF